MKNVKPLIVSSLLTLLVLGSFVYTSCTSSNKCSSVVCLNGGACNAGSCTCPTGFTGSDCGAPATSTISFTNNTHTPVNIIANGASSILALGGTVNYTGYYGNPLNVVASTSGMGTTTKKVVGSVITWDLAEVFPQSGSVNYSIDVDSTYFFLEIQNNDPTETAAGIYVNYGKPARQTYDSVTVPNNGSTYGIGYYRAYDSTEIYINYSDGTGYWTAYAFIPPVTFSKNQSFLLTLP